MFCTFVVICVTFAEISMLLVCIVLIRMILLIRRLPCFRNYSSSQHLSCFSIGINAVICKLMTSDFVGLFFNQINEFSINPLFGDYMLLK